MCEEVLTALSDVTRVQPPAPLPGCRVIDSTISSIDGETGELRYRGYAIEDLAARASFEEVVWLLWHGELPTPEELGGFRRDMIQARRLDHGMYPLIARVGVAQPPMAALRTMVSSMNIRRDPLDPAPNRESNLFFALQVTAMMPAIVAALYRKKNRLELIQPELGLSHAGNFLWMLKGQEPDPEFVRVLNTCMILHAEHGFNASTYAARVTSSARSDMYAAVTSAIGTLAGPLHGGASTAVMNMLLEQACTDSPRAYILGKIARGERIPGFGHRVYKRVTGPRVRILKKLSAEIAEKTGERHWHQLAVRIEEIVRDAKGLEPNVDYYAATTYHGMCIPPELFTCVFAAARVAGWAAHIMEQYGDRLIRPRARYVGPAPRDWVLVSERS